MRVIPRPVAALLAALLAAGCAAAPRGVPSAPRPGAVRVRLVHLDHPVADATVTAVINPGIAFQERRATAVAGADGHALLELPPGSWYLSAASERPALAGWYGSNPLQVRPGEAADVAIRAVPSPPPARTVAAAPGEEAVTGEVVGETGPVAGAAVAFYLDASTQFRGPGYLEVRSDEAGRFAARLSPGSYWIFARRRSGAAAYGPLEVGDDFGWYAGNPLAVGGGETHEIRVGAVRVLRKSGWGEPSGLRTRLAGTVRDAGGRPLAGYRAFLHAKPAMLGKPEFVSEPSGADGAFVIWVDREGTYYLGARAEIGRARDEREAIGLYRGAADHAVTVRLGAQPPPALDVVVGEPGGAP